MAGKTPAAAPFVLIAALMALSLGGCAPGSDFYREAGADVDEGNFGNPSMNNYLVMTGQRDATMMLGQRFAREVNTTITFPFNSAELTPEAQATLRQQAGWIRQFPELQFSVYGHTDLVGSNSYNKNLGKRRAQAVVNYFATLGLSSSRLHALVSYGETHPVIPTPGPEEQNRRTVTEVSGFVQKHPNVLNGKYAEIIWRDYQLSAQTAEVGVGGATTAAAASGGGAATASTAQSTSP